MSQFRYRLARAVRAEHRAGADPQVNPIERPGFPEPLDQAFGEN
jgi:hypothetical protein